MDRVAKTAKAKSGIGQSAARPSRAHGAADERRVEQRLTDALAQQAATDEILRLMAASPADTRPVLQGVAERAARLCRAPFARVFLVDGGVLRPVAHVSVDGEPPIPMHAMPLGRKSVSGRATLDRKTIHHADVVPLLDADYPDARENVREAGIRAILAVPLNRDGDAYGAIVLWRRNPGLFAPDQVALMETFARQAAIAIQNVRLFHATQEALERQTATSGILRVISQSPTDAQPVFEAIAAAALNLCGASLANVFTYDGERIHLAAVENVSDDPEYLAAVHTVFPRPPGRDTCAGRAVLARNIVAIPDVADDREYGIGAQTLIGGFRSVLGVPLMRDETAIGAIVIGRTQAGLFPDTQITLLKTFADQAVIAIENVRLFNETSEALEQQTATSEILRVISRSRTDVQPVFDTIAAAALKLCRASAANVFTFDGELVWLASLVSAHPSPDYAETFRKRWPMPPGRGAAATRAILTCSVVEIADVLEDADYAVTAELLVGGFRGVLSVPLVRDGAPIGAISVGRPEAGAFPAEQVALLQTFAEQAVIAIENVRLFTELEARTTQLTRSVGELKALGEVGQAVSSTLDLETVLSTIVSRATQLAGMDAGAIYEYDQTREQFYLRAMNQFPDDLVAALRVRPIPKGEGVLGRLAVVGEPVQVHDIMDASIYQSGLREILIRLGYRSLLAVPLLREDHLIGGLVVNRKSPGAFTPELIDLLKAFATQSALAIQNARLFREIAEKGRQLEEASRHKSQFLASMSHELRTPLNAILGFNEMILGEIYGEVPASMREPLEDIQSSGRHLLRLINNVLDLAKIEAGRMDLALADYSVQDTVESVRATLRPLAADKGLEFVVMVPADTPLAYGDSGRITQCLVNLAGNSLKFTKSGRVEVSVEHQDGVLAYRVSDTGIGIPPDKIAGLFTEFKQTDATIASEYGGSGLGLSITRKFVEMHGGRIWVESELGKGSVFTFEIPLRACEKAAG